MRPTLTRKQRDALALLRAAATDRFVTLGQGIWVPDTTSEIERASIQLQGLRDRRCAGAHAVHALVRERILEIEPSKPFLAEHCRARRLTERGRAVLAEMPVESDGESGGT